MKKIQRILELDILPYRFDAKRDSFVCRAIGGSDSLIFKSMAKIVTVLEEEGISYTIFDKNIQILDQEALDEAGSMVVKLDHEGNVTYFNQYACNVTGYKADEVVGKNWFKYFIPVKDESRINQLFKDVLANKEQGWNCTNEILCKDNSLKMVNWENNIVHAEEQENKDTVFSIGIVAS